MQRDFHAARKIVEFREDLGLSPEDLSYLISSKSPRTPVSGRTIRRVEAHGAIPTPRVKFGIATAFDLKPSDIWAPVRMRTAA